MQKRGEVGEGGGGGVSSTKDGCVGRGEAAAGAEQWHSRIHPIAAWHIGAVV